MKKKRVHFVGIKGVGMTPLAIIAKEAGFVVSGCDIANDFITDVPLAKAGIPPLAGFSPDHIHDIDLVITTGAHGGYDNPEVKAAQEKGVPILTQGQAVGEFMNGKLLNRRNTIGISVAGSHGKTTTTAILATLFKAHKKDPSYVIGTGSVLSLGLPGHFGKGNYFIAEADEYATEPKHDKTPKFLWQKPHYLVFTNIELDHIDLFPTIESIRSAFLQFAQNLDNKGVLIACGDDIQIREMLKQYTGRVITYGKFPDNDFVIKNVSISGNQMFFWVDSAGVSLGEFQLGVVGEHNALNALAAIITAYEAGIPIPDIKKGLPQFVGTERRAEYIGKLPFGALLFDDYAHHPTEITKTLKAFRQAYPKSKIVCVFQPHMYSRTKALFNEFSHSFSDADTVILTDIYTSEREAIDPTVSSRLLANAMNTFKRGTLFLPTLSSVVEYIDKSLYQSDTIVITMGAGDVYKISSKLKVQS